MEDVVAFFWRKQMESLVCAAINDACLYYTLVEH